MMMMIRMNIMQICPSNVLPPGIEWITYELFKSGVVMWNEESVFLGLKYSEMRATLELFGMCFLVGFWPGLLKL